MEDLLWIKQINISNKLYCTISLLEVIVHVVEEKGDIATHDMIERYQTTNKRSDQVIYQAHIIIDGENNLKLTTVQ